MKVLVLALVLAASLDAEPGFQRAMDAYRVAEFEKALLGFQDLGLNASLKVEDKARLLVWTALCHLQLGDEAKARRDLLSALELDLDLELPEETPPKLVEAHPELRAEAVARLKAKPPPRVEDGSPPEAPEPVGRADKWTPQRTNTVVGGLVGFGIAAVVAGAFGVDYAFAAAAEGDPRAEAAKERDLIGLGVAGGMALTSGLIALFATVWPSVQRE